MFGEWRKNRISTYVTPETVIPEMPKVVLNEPDDVVYHMKQVQLNEQIEELRANINEQNKTSRVVVGELSSD